MRWRLPYRTPESHCEHTPGTDSTPVLKAEHVTVKYSNLVQTALEDINLELMEGENGVLVGPNGAGKSTFLKTAAGLIKPLSGSVTTFGCPAEHCHPHTCYLPQRTTLNWDFPISVHRMVLMGSYVRCGWFKVAGKKEHRRTRDILKKLKLDHLADRQINQLSGGQQQRLLLARALLHDARLYLLDEPFTAVDRETLEIICRVLTELTQSGRTLLTSTHFLNTLPLRFSHSWQLIEGRIQNS